MNVYHRWFKKIYILTSFFSQSAENTGNAFNILLSAMKQFGLLFISLLIYLYSASIRAAPIDDIRILIDVSGSMIKTDPKNLRVPAMRMLNGLIPSGSRAGVWTFGRYVNMEVKWGKVDDQWRELADQGVANIHSRGQFTNIESALLRSSASWKKADKNSRRNIILLTDGQVDISKDPEKNQASRDKILKQILPNLVKNGVNVHTIALSGYSDEALLRQIAVKTSGSFEIANTAEDLQRIFLRMFERAAKPDTIPLTSETFSVDNSIREMTLLVFRSGDKKTRLIQPDGKTFSEKQTDKHVHWRNDLGYDLITVKKPLAGKWKLDADMDPDNRVMIVTDLKLDVEAPPAYLTPDASIDLKVELHSKGKKISKKSFLKFVNFNVLHNFDGKSSKTTLKMKVSRDINDKGVYLHQIPSPLPEGSHELVVSADARIFDRSKRLKFEVQWPVSVEINKGKKPGEFELEIKAREEYINPESLNLEVRLKRPDGLQQPLILALNQETGTWSSKILANEHDGLHQVLINVKAESVLGSPVDHALDGFTVLGVKIEPELDKAMKDADELQQAKEEAAPEESPQENGGPDLWTSLLIVGGINGVLILLGVGGFFLLRNKRSVSTQFDLLNNDSDTDQEGKADD